MTDTEQRYRDALAENARLRGEARMRDLETENARLRQSLGMGGTPQPKTGADAFADMLSGDGPSLTQEVADGFAQVVREHRATQ